MGAWRKYGCFILTALLAAFSTGCFVAGAKISAMKDNGTIHVEGEVCDGRGNILENVKVKGYKTKQTGFMASKTTDIADIVSGHFSLTFINCSTVGLDFVKEEYRRSHINAPGWGESGAPDLPYKKKGIRVVLYKRGQEAVLEDYSGTLEYDADGSGAVLVIDPKNPPRYEKSVKQIEDLHNSERLPNRSVFIIPSTMEDGKINTVKIDKSNEKSRTAIYPKKIRVIMKAKEGGFIKFAPIKNVPLEVQMSEAPEAGYKKEIVLSAEKLNSMARKQSRSQDKGYWFYFKMNDYYGKGWFRHITSRNCREYLKLKVEMYLQPDKTRRVGDYMNP